MMHNEEFERNFERKMEFILNQQAQFAAGIQRLEEAQTVTDQKVAHAAEAAAHAAEAAARTAETVDNFSGLVLEGFRVVVDRFKDTDVKINALVDSQILTDEKLRDLAAVVDRHIREGHKGFNGAP